MNTGLGWGDRWDKIRRSIPLMLAWTGAIAKAGFGDKFVRGINDFRLTQILHQASHRLGINP
jgi:hypothetical protein